MNYLGILELELKFRGPVSSLENHMYWFYILQYKELLAVTATLLTLHQASDRIRALHLAINVYSLNISPGMPLNDHAR